MNASLSPEDVTQIRTSFAKILGLGDQFPQVMYRNLFERAPNVRTMFSPDMSSQREKLVATLATVVKHADRLSDVDGPVAELGRRHAGMGVEPAHYDLLREVFMQSLEECLGDAMSDETRHAWALLYDIVAAKMLSQD